MCPYSRTAECQLERKWLQIAIDTTHNPQLAMPFICFSSSSPCTRHGPHTLSRTIPIQRAIKDHAASHVLLTACYLAPALLLPFSNRPCFCLHPTFLLQRLHVPLCGRDESKASNNQKGCYLRQGGNRCNFAGRVCRTKPQLQIPRTY